MNNMETILEKRRQVLVLQKEIKELEKQNVPHLEGMLKNFIQAHQQYITSIGWVQKVQSYDDSSYYTVDYGAPTVSFSDSFLNSLTEKDKEDLLHKINNYYGGVGLNIEDEGIPQQLPEEVRVEIQNMFDFIEDNISMFEEAFGEEKSIIVTTEGIEAKYTDWS